MAAEARLTGLAPAKVNLFLHIIGRRRDGYHVLESLVGFADCGDRLELEPGRPLTLIVEGPFAGALAAEDENLVLRAARAFAAAFPETRSGQFQLTKNLPVASGIGGGSSDAATALRLLAAANAVPLDAPDLLRVAASLGADVPVCLDPHPRLMRGIGHDLGPRVGFTPVPALLVNPNVAVETHAAFSKLGLQPGDRFQYAGPAGQASEDTVATLAATTRNDLEEAAIRLAPAVAVVLDELRSLPGCRLARMSGSGATCFALFASPDEAKTACARIEAATQGWWVRECAISVAT
ncbi:MAG TPA: 4-(cytidine 5'-diphospho)-2-C-methyl-D-erythritol kinase [Rhabdaerophilum sp.]|nr:4-(cytidine 5'-diphospho)-2-C-methyl-D-erythritol kinase [Rhabdaerophilum sp.]